MSEQQAETSEQEAEGSGPRPSLFELTLGAGLAGALAAACVLSLGYTLIFAGWFPEVTRMAEGMGLFAFSLGCSGVVFAAGFGAVQRCARLWPSLACVVGYATSCAAVVALLYPRALNDEGDPFHAMFALSQQAPRIAWVAMNWLGLSGLAGALLLCARQRGASRASGLVVTLAGLLGVALLGGLRWSNAISLVGFGVFACFALFFAFWLPTGARWSNALLRAIHQPVGPAPDVAPLGSWAEQLAQEARRLRGDLAQLAPLLPRLELFLVGVGLARGVQASFASPYVPSPLFLPWIGGVLLVVAAQAQVRGSSARLALAGAATVVSFLPLAPLRWLACAVALGVSWRAPREPGVRDFWVGVGVTAVGLPWLTEESTWYVYVHFAGDAWSLLALGGLLGLAREATKLRGAHFLALVPVVGVSYGLTLDHVTDYGPIALDSWWVDEAFERGQWLATLVALSCAGTALLGFRRGRAWGVAPTLVVACVWAWPGAWPWSDPDALARDRLEVRAAADDPEALLGLSGLRRGERDTAQAAELLRRAAELEDPEAMYRYAHELEGGRLVPRNPAEAQAWFARAARAGHPLAAARVEPSSETPR